MAFGAQERFVLPGLGGKGVMRAQIRIGNSIVMMAEENPQQSRKSAETTRKILLTIVGPLPPIAGLDSAGNSAGKNGLSVLPIPYR